MEAVMVTFRVSPLSTALELENGPIPRSCPEVPEATEAIKAPYTLDVALIENAAGDPELLTDPAETVPGVQDMRSPE
jgi:hypothetical protein